MNHQMRKRRSVVYFLALVVTAVMLMTAVAQTLNTRTYTTDADFDEGVLVGVEHDTVADQLQLSVENVILPFIWVPNNQGTVSKVDTETGDELGRYWVVPPGLPENGLTSRTTVDLDGSCWVGNRRAGTVVKIGLYEAGQWIDRNEDGICQTSQDTDSDGDITGDEILAWGEDECVLYEVVLIPGREGTYAPGTFRYLALADSASEFSNTQGQDNWYYGYYDGDGPAPYRNADFEELPQYGPAGNGLPAWNTNIWYIAPWVNWTALWNVGGHPHGLNHNWDPYVPVEHWVVRRWVSEVAGSITITGTLNKSDDRCGDGITGYILVDGVVVWSQYIAYNDSVGVSYNIDEDVNIGSLVDFAIDPNGNDWCDSTRFTALIYTEHGLENLRGPVWRPGGGKFGGALEFDGAGYADCGNPPILDFGTGDWTVSAWIKAPVNPGTSTTIFAKGGDHSGGIRYQMLLDSGGHIQCVVDDNTDKYNPAGDITVIDGQWHHIVMMRRDGTKLRLYVDGVEDMGVTNHAKSTIPAGYDLSGTSQHNAYIGAVTDNRDLSGNTLEKLFEGLIDDVAIFSRALNADDIIQLYDQGGTSFISDSSLLALWALDEMEGITASDSSGNGNDGTLRASYDISLYDTAKWNTSPRGLAVDASNNLWAGTYATMMYYYIDGSTGQILRSVDVSSVNHTAYGAVIDENGILWSSGHNKNHVLRLDPSDDSFSAIDLGHFVYGLGVDYLGHLFVSGWNGKILTRIDIGTGLIDWSQVHGLGGTKGVACTGDNDVWVVSQSSGNLYRFDNEGNYLAEIYVGEGPTGVAVDADGKVWICNRYDEYIKRIDPATNLIDLEKPIIGSEGHYSYSDMTGIIARTITTRTGTWTVVYESGVEDTPWGIVSWNSDEPEGTSVSVQVRSSNDGSTWSLPETAGNGLALTSTPGGKYLEVKTTLQMVSGDVSPVLYDLTVNARPVADAGLDQTVECACNTAEGTKVTLDGTGSSDADGDPLTYTWTGPFDESPTSGPNPTMTLSDGCPDEYEVTLVVNDGVQDSDPDTVVITVQDTTPPAISTLNADYLLATIGQTVTFSVGVLDDCDANVDVEWNFGDGTAPSFEFDPSHEYELGGIYTVTITATDDCDNATMDSIIVVVYDPTAGFTTGGGWFVPDGDSFIDGVVVTDAVSKANFGFIVKYKKGADNPDGNLEFQYKAGDIDLKSQDMEWLVVQSATKVRFKGKATINGQGEYTFKVTAEDNGEPGAGLDMFCIEIWLGVVDDVENTPQTPKHKAKGVLGGGNIQIHQK